MGSWVHQPHEMQAECVAQDIGVKGRERIFTIVEGTDRDGNDVGQDKRSWTVDPESESLFEAQACGE